MRAIKKMANAFYADVNSSNNVKGVAQYSVKRFKEKHGGLWVGGAVVLNDQGIQFLPNKLNQNFHDFLEGVKIEASEIESVACRFGWFTGIVEVAHTNGIFRFRCYGAKNLVDHYNEHTKETVLNSV